MLCQCLYANFGKSLGKWLKFLTYASCFCGSRCWRGKTFGRFLSLRRWLISELPLRFLKNIWRENPVNLLSTQPLRKLPDSSPRIDPFARFRSSLNWMNQWMNSTERPSSLLTSHHPFLFITSLGKVPEKFMSLHVFACLCIGTGPGIQYCRFPSTTYGF